MGAGRGRSRSPERCQHGGDVVSNDPNGEFPKNTRTHAITKSQAEEIIVAGYELVGFALQLETDPSAERAKSYESSRLAFEARVRALVSPAKQSSKRREFP